MNVQEQAKVNITITEVVKTANETWDDADYTWDEASGTWDVPGSHVTKASKTTITITTPSK